MPGLVGFTNNSYLSKDDTKNILKKMQDYITHHDFYIRDELFSDDRVCASRVHVNIINKESQPYCQNGVYIWLDGEFYNQSELLPSGGESTDPQILYQLYTSNNKDFSFLKAIDGFYSAVIYDKKQNKVYLLIDRYGLRHLYWTIHKGQLVWASEVKAFLALPDFKARIDQQAVKEFFEVGYLLEDRTWFEEAELLSSGTVLSWSIQKQTMKKIRYWWWDKIKPLTGKVDEDEISEELGRLFIQAVEKRCREGEKIGLGLSGGLDSRAVLAAIPGRVKPIYAITMGKKDSDDVRIAQKVAKLKGAIHHIFELNKKNWLMPRLNGVWWTDGQLNLMHMHGIETLPYLRGVYDINLNGFAGDLIVGGSYLKDKRYFDTVDINLAAEVMHVNPNYLINFTTYSNLKKMDFYFLQNRVKRFTFGGAKLTLTVAEFRKPFYDNKLIEFIYSLPDEIRFKSRIYCKTLLTYFPLYYKSTPWQKTGVPISYPELLVDLFGFGRKVRNKLLRELSPYLEFKYVEPNSYTDYPNWIRQEPGRSFFKKVLLNESALYPEYLNKQDVINKLEAHLEGQNCAEKLCLYLTFEIWLQQVFNEKYKSGEK